jgi:branched-chain amino acid aminotransferase
VLFLYGDAVLVKIVNSKILFLEDHYFRLMASMRVVRMEIPMNFTMEYLEEQIVSLATLNSLSALRVPGLLCSGMMEDIIPVNTVSFLIHTTGIEDMLYASHQQKYEVELFKDFYVSRQLLSSIKTTNKILNIS